MSNREQSDAAKKAARRASNALDEAGARVTAKRYPAPRDFVQLDSHGRERLGTGGERMASERDFGQLSDADLRAVVDQEINYYGLRDYFKRARRER